jgi:hypothetical protein
MTTKSLSLVSVVVQGEGLSFESLATGRIAVANRLSKERIAIPGDVLCVDENLD